MPGFGDNPFGTGSWGSGGPGSSGPSAAFVSATAKNAAEQVARLFGNDIFFDVSNPGGANTKTSAAGDWILAGGREALRQAIIRRIITNPGEWAALPDYGVGARLFVKSRNTAATRNELEERIRGQVLQDPRVETVDEINVEFITDGLRLSVVITPKGQAARNEPLVASVEVT